MNSKRGCFVHAIYFYKDKHGNQPVLDYMRELARCDNKDSWIKLNKLNDYIELLSQHGTRAGQPYIKHLDAEIWELRPLRDRILLVAWLDGSFVLLHHFVKKTQKTPRREIEKAKRALQDLKERGLRDEE
nr:type II toxin-antitoxin system RelE/ParE family toxin [Streptococcus gordonii]